jgi:hypothetical protein
MPAVDLRRFLGVAIASEGIKNTTDFLVVQRAAGAAMIVEIGDGEAYVKDDHVSSNAGGFYWGQNIGTVQEAISDSHATLPRVDRVVLEFRDAFLGDTANDGPGRFRVIAGTPTAGATLTNLNGAAAIPGSAILLANVLVGAAVTSITTADIDTTIRTVRPVLELAGSGWTRLQEVILTADGAISFPSISQGYRHLKVEASLRSNRAATTDTVGVRFNNDSTADYESQTATFNGTVSGGGLGGVRDTAGTSGAAGSVAGNSATAALFGTLSLQVNDYAAAAKKPTYKGDSFQSASSTDTTITHFAGNGKTAEAVARIDLVPTGGGTNWKSGSVATLYGLR